MSEHPAFELVREQHIAEISSLAKLYRHRKTGAEVLSRRAIASVSKRM